MPEPQPVKFHLDEHMDPDIAAALRRFGIGVTTTSHAALLGQDDPRLLDPVNMADPLHLLGAKRSIGTGTYARAAIAPRDRPGAPD